MAKYNVIVYEFEKSGTPYTCDHFAVNPDGDLVLGIEVNSGGIDTAEVLAIYARGKWVRIVNNTTKENDNG